MLKNACDSTQRVVYEHFDVKVKCEVKVIKGLIKGSITAQDATSYSLTATAINEQAGDGNLTLNSVGDRTWNGQDGWDHDS